MPLPLEELTSDFKTTPLTPPPAPPVAPTADEPALVVNPRDQLKLIEPGIFLQVLQLIFLDGKASE